MYNKLNLALGCLLFINILGCASKADLELVSNDYRLAQEEINELHLRIQELEQEKNNCQKAMAKNEAIISVQSRVIKLIDDPKQTLQKSIQEQLLEQNIELESPFSNQ
jgi:protein tyrosine/serine phosphatase